MKIAIIPWSEEYLRNSMFDIKNKKLNRDNLLTPYYYMKKEFERYGDELNTIDIYINITEIDYFLFFEFDPKWIRIIAKNHLEDRMIYCNGEPEVVKPINSPRGYNKLKKYFPYIMTWNDELVDEVRIFKRIIPYHFEKKTGAKPFNQKKLLTNISGNKHSTSKKELYSEREKIISYFEQNYGNQFDLYGTGWDIKKHPSYKGTPENKYDIYFNYKFALSLENTKNVKGYVTEKIFDCLVSGVVPVYQGADDIVKYVPQEWFIDYSSFKSLEELADYLSNMTEVEYKCYQNAIEHFLKTNIDEKLNGAVYAQNVYHVIEKKTQRGFSIGISERIFLFIDSLRNN